MNRWHVVATPTVAEVWSHDGEMPIAVCHALIDAHRIVDEHNAHDALTALVTDATGRFDANDLHRTAHYFRTELARITS